MVRVQHVVSGGPAGEVAYVVEVVDGEVVGATEGTDPDAELVLAEKHDDAVRIVAGELHPDVAFMRGRAKLTGSMGTYMDLLPTLRSDQYRQAQSRFVTA